MPCVFGYQDKTIVNSLPCFTMQGGPDDESESWKAHAGSLHGLGILLTWLAKKQVTRGQKGFLQVPLMMHIPIPAIRGPLAQSLSKCTFVEEWRTTHTQSEGRQRERGERTKWSPITQTRYPLVPSPLFSWWLQAKGMGRKNDTAFEPWLWYLEIYVWIW